MNMLRWIIKKAVYLRLRQVQAAVRDPAATQERLLLRLVRYAKNTEWGRDHDYHRIRSARDYQQAVPIACYEDLAPLWHRAFDGARDVTWPGHIKYFALSSGTTTAECKALPVSRQAIRANFRSGATLLGLCERLAPGSALAAGKTLYLGGSTRLQRRGACWEGDSSGINAARMPGFTWRYRLPERDVAAIADWEARIDAICHRYLRSPVRVIVGLPSWTLILFRRLIDAAREQRSESITSVDDVWPELRVFVSFGMAFEPYREQFNELMGRRIPVINSYSSSEGGFSAIQTDPADPGMQLELDTCAFFEFVPAEELERPDPPRLTLEQVETGVDYALLVSTPAGIWAYDVGDVIRFTSLRPPKIVVVGRTHLTLNTFGEHVIQEELEQALVGACNALRTRASDFTVFPVPPTAQDPRGRHLWLIEFDGPEPAPAAFAERLDAGLTEQGLDYRTLRNHDVSMLSPLVVPLAPGTFYEWARRYDALGGQHKVPRVARSQEMVDELQELSKSLRQPPRP